VINAIVEIAQKGIALVKNAIVIPALAASNSQILEMNC